MAAAVDGGSRSDFRSHQPGQQRLEFCEQSGDERTGRGTVTDADDIQDARLDQAVYQLVAGSGNLHAGFYEQILSVLTGLTNIARLFFTGHSPGSGLSSLAVADVITNIALRPSAGRVLLHYNFASPRVGDPQFAYMMNGMLRGSVAPAKRFGAATRSASRALRSLGTVHRHYPPAIFGIR